MPWTTPETFTAGQTLTAASMNAQSENLRVLRALANVQQHSVTAASGPTALAAGAESAAILSVAITPTATTSKVLVTCTIQYDFEAGVGVFATLYRGATAVGVGDAAGSRVQVTGTGSSLGGANASQINFTYLDSPATTSATTYSVKLRHWSSLSRNYYINRSLTDTDSNLFPRAASALVAQEIPA